MSFEKPFVEPGEQPTGDKDLLEGAVAGRYGLMSKAAAEEMRYRVDGTNLIELDYWLRGIEGGATIANDLKEFPQDMDSLKRALVVIEKEYTYADVLKDDTKKDRYNVFRYYLSGEISRIELKRTEVIKSIGGNKALLDRSLNYPFVLPDLNRLMVDELQGINNGLQTIRMSYLRDKSLPGDKNSVYREKVKELLGPYL